MGYATAANAEDEKQAARAGLLLRPLIRAEIEKHVACFGISAEHCSHTPLGQLADGPKVKVVLAAATWLNPHIIVLDEPTNYLDRDGIAALSLGLQEFEGGWVVITHDAEFAMSIATETWNMQQGELTREV